MATDDERGATDLDRPALARRAVAYYAAALVVMAAMFFGPAGTFDYWQAWLYLAVLFAIVALLGTHLIRREPELLARRLRTREREVTQQRVIQVSLALFVLAFLLPGFDRRFGWSAVPPAVVVGTNVGIVIAYALFARVLLANRYASRIIEVEAGQSLATTGPYAVVRHPMYVAMLAIWLLSPIALGSWWAALTMLPIVPVIVVRIRNEEAVLQRDLAGYADYMGRVRYRLIPGIW